MSALSQAEQEAAAELAKNLADPMWRICNLYFITTKTKTGEIGPDGEEKEQSLVVKFKPNRAQRRFLSRLWSRNTILKARQLGFTTLICIAWLDHAMFNPNSRCGIVAQDRETAENIFTDKVKFAYDNLPPALRAAMPLKKCTSTTMRFGHNDSMIRVATSVRGSTIHRLHVSEFGKICAKYPDKAAEVMTGSIPAVPLDGGIIVIESTAEGREGDFYDITMTALGHAQQKKALNERDYRLHFYAWWDAPEYRMSPVGVVITEKDHEYFDQVEAIMGISLDIEQRAWYVATRDADFKNKPERMWQEYPSTPEEAFQVSTEGTYYAKQMADARKQGRITAVPHFPGVPVNTFWDIGHGDGTAIWLHQHVGARDHFIKFIEGWGEPYSYFVAEMQKTGWVWGRHYLPHDGAHVRQGQDYDSQLSPQQMLENLGLRSVEIVDRVEELQHGIQAVRDAFSRCVFDEAGCKEGLIHLEMYRKAWNTRTQCWSDHPLKDIHTEGADSFRQFAQGFEASSGGTRKRKKSSWRTA